MMEKITEVYMYNPVSTDEYDRYPAPEALAKFGAAVAAWQSGVDVSP